jgi:hypothetical protein
MQSAVTAVQNFCRHCPRLSENEHASSAANPPPRHHPSESKGASGVSPAKVPKALSDLKLWGSALSPPRPAFVARISGANICVLVTATVNLRYINEGYRSRRLRQLESGGHLDCNFARRWPHPSSQLTLGLMDWKPPIQPAHVLSQICQHLDQRASLHVTGSLPV